MGRQLNLLMFCIVAILGLSAGGLVIASALTGSVNLVYAAIAAGVLAVLANVFYAVVRKRSAGITIDTQTQPPVKQTNKPVPALMR